MSTAIPLELDATPSPRDAPLLHGTVLFTTKAGVQVRLPPAPLSGLSGTREAEGVCFVEVETGAKVKQKQTSGSGTGDTAQKRAQKSETTVEAIEPAKVTITYKFTHRIYAESQEALALIDPNGENGGDPLDIQNPKTAGRKVTSIILEKLSAEKEQGGIYEVKLTCLEWNPPPPAAPGDGADTATQVGKWAPSYGGAPSTPINPNATSYGFNGPKAPKAKP